MHRQYASSAVLLTVVLGLFGQQRPNTKTDRKSSQKELIAKGRVLFDKKCSVCHYTNTDEKKIGPSLKGFSKRSTFITNKNRVTDESLRDWIENGDQLMPPFKDVLDADQINSVIAYVKTL